MGLLFDFSIHSLLLDPPPSGGKDPAKLSLLISQYVNMSICQLKRFLKNCPSDFSEILHKLEGRKGEI